MSKSHSIIAIRNDEFYARRRYIITGAIVIKIDHIYIRLSIILYVICKKKKNHKDQRNTFNMLGLNFFFLSKLTFTFNIFTPTNLNIIDPKSYKKNI